MYRAKHSKSGRRIIQDVHEMLRSVGGMASKMSFVLGSTCADKLCRHIVLPSTNLASIEGQLVLCEWSKLMRYVLHRDKRLKRGYSWEGADNEDDV